MEWIPIKKKKKIHFDRSVEVILFKQNLFSEKLLRFNFRESFVFKAGEGIGSLSRGLVVQESSGRGEDVGIYVLKWEGLSNLEGTMKKSPLFSTIS